MAGRIHFAMLSSIALLFLYIAVFGLFVFFNISVPIVRLGRAMDKAGKGDMDSRVDIKTGDEIEQLAGSFNQMMADLKFSREELTNEKERLRITLQSIGDGVIATDIAGNVALMNDVAANLTGWTKAEAAGRPVGEVFRIVNQKTRMPCESPIMRAITSGGVVGLANDTVLISRDGTERIILDSGSPIRDSQGNITGGVLVFRDNTEQRNALEGVRKLSRALEFSPAVVLITDPTGRIEYANPKFTALTGYHRGEVIGTTARILRPDKLAPAEHRRLWETISAGKEWRGEFLNKNKKDEPYWESVAISSLKDAGDTVTNFLIVAEDISQSKLFAEKLAEEKKTLEIFHRAAVNQELDALGLKKEVNDLLAAGGRPIKYQEVLEAEGLWDSNPDGDKERQQDA